MVVDRVSLVRIGVGVRHVLIYPNDHRPAHVHVIGPQGEAVFNLRCPHGPAELRESDRRVGRVVVKLDTGVELAFPPHLAQGLEGARPDDLTDIQVSPAGTGLHFPKLDADLYVPALLEGVLGSRQWMAPSMGRAGGASTSTAKVDAARANGKLGGRPRKTAAV